MLKNGYLKITLEFCGNVSTRVAYKWRRTKGKVYKQNLYSHFIVNIY